MPSDSDRAVEAIVEHFIAKGEAMSIKEISAALSWPPAKVRRTADKVFDTDNGWNRIEPTTKTINIVSRAYGNVMGSRSVAAYTVTRDHMAAMIRAYRAQTTPPTSSTHGRMEHR